MGTYYVLMRPQKKTTRKKQRIPVKEPGIAKRLKLLQKPSESGRAFAKRLGVDFRLLRLWLRGERAPAVNSLRTIAKQTVVSLDWLLDGIGHDEAECVDPILRGQWLDSPALEQEVSRWVMRESGISPAQLAIGDTTANPVSAHEVFTSAAEIVRREFAAWHEWKSRMENAHADEVGRIRNTIVSNYVAYLEGHGQFIVWGEFNGYLVRMLSFFLPAHSSQRANEAADWRIAYPRVFGHQDTSGAASERPLTAMFRPRFYGIVHPYLNQRVDIPLSDEPSEDDVTTFLACRFGCLRDSLEGRVPKSVPRAFWVPSASDLTDMSYGAGGARLSEAMAVLTIPRAPRL